MDHTEEARNKQLHATAVIRFLCVSSDSIQESTEPRHVAKDNFAADGTNGVGPGGNVVSGWHQVISNTRTEDTRKREDGRGKREVAEFQFQT